MVKLPENKTFRWNNHNERANTEMVYRYVARHSPPTSVLKLNTDDINDIFKCSMLLNFFHSLLREKTVRNYLKVR